MERAKKKRPYEFYERDILRKSTKLSDSMYVSVFGVNRSMMEGILTETAPYLPLGASPNRKSLCQKERLEMFFFFARGDVPQRHCAYSFNCGKSTVDENNRIVINALFENFVPNHIYLPDASQAKEEARKFAEGTNLPPIIWAAMDGFHTGVRISQPEPLQLSSNTHSLHPY